MRFLLPFQDRAHVNMSPNNRFQPQKTPSAFFAAELRRWGS